MNIQRILVVDDNIDIMRLVKTVLTYAGYEVATAGGGAEALEQIRANHFDGVVLDLSMPGVTGATVCHEIKRFSNVPVIVMTGHDPEEELVRSVYGIADMIVLKPFDPMKMPLYVKQCLSLGARPSKGAAQTKRQTIIQSMYV